MRTSNVGVGVRVARIHAQTAVPVSVVPNGTVAADGTITLGTALATTYAGGAWIRLPAGAIVGGLAGLYWCVFSSTTVGAVKTNFVDASQPFTPYVPAGGLTAAVGSGAAYTQATGAALTVANVLIPGRAMGEYGALRQQHRFSILNNANTKTITGRFGASIVSPNYAGANVTGLSSTGTVRNRGILTRQEAANGTDSTAPMYPAVDTSADVTWLYTIQLATATDYATLEGFTMEILPSQ